jgi:antitoxin component of RelBE/YafQ-DinJ toxin-antitoxin module
MATTSVLSTIIDSRVKKAVTSFCKRRGLKLRHVVEQALIEQMEDEMDLETYLARRDENTVSLEKILAGRKK